MTANSIPTWLLVLVAVLSAGLLVWRFRALMGGWRHATPFAIVPVAVAVVAATAVAANSPQRTGGTAHISAKWALLVYIDFVLAFTIGSLPIGRSLRQWASGHAGGPLPRSMPGKAPMIWISVWFATFAVLAAGEFFAFR
jgi:hypothetical protein